MEQIWLALSITILAQPNGDGTPNVNSVPHRYYVEEGQCLDWVKDRYENPWGSIDPVSGAAVLNYFYDCVPQSKTELVEAYQQASSNGSSSKLVPEK